MFEIHVVEECGINGFILALISDCTSHVRNGQVVWPQGMKTEVVEIKLVYFKKNNG
jgi:hypothetical protein